MNPFYNNDAKGLNLELRAFDEPDLEYEFNTLIFVRPTNASDRVYTAQDSGCSCPIPFEDLEGDNQEAVLAKMTRVGSYAEAKKVFEAWNTEYFTSSKFEESGIEKWFNP